MLTKEKLKSIIDCPVTIEDNLIRAIYQNGSIVTVKRLTELGYDIYQVQLTCKKSFYLEYNHKMKTVKLVYKGKEYDGLYAIPENASNIENMVFSLLVNDFSNTFQTCRQRVINFCRAKGINYDGYLANTNIFDTIKKKVGHYLDMKLTRVDQWNTVSLETLIAWKARQKRRGKLL